ncbi:unnamed protein product, partial [Didymodactylos carnosus]
DSLFVEFPHLSRAQAFEQSYLLVKAINKLYPTPIKLKFEKIYQPSVLESKKRYAGMSYETLEQTQPKFDAKGIETIRRDTCSAVSKMLERSLKLLFRTKDVTRVKQYVQLQCQKIYSHRVNLIDFVFAKEYRGKKSYHPTAPVPALRIALKRLAKNPLSEPNIGERVPFIIGLNLEQPNANLIDCIWTLDKALMINSNFQLNSNYYVRKQILPALDRAFALIGVDVFKWLEDISQTDTITTIEQRRLAIKQQHGFMRRCHLCSKLATTPLCDECRKNSNQSLLTAEIKANELERQHSSLQRICLACSDHMNGWSNCTTGDCPVRYRILKLTQQMIQAQETRTIVNNFCTDQTS